MAIIIYTWKTWQLKDLTAKEITYQIRPLVILENQLLLKNIGNGIAIDIEIEKFQINQINLFTKYLELAKNNQNLDFIFFTALDYLIKDSSKKIEVKGLDKNNRMVALPTEISNMIHNQLDGLKGFSIIIKYRDIEGTLYKSVMSVIDDRFQLVSVK